MTTVTAGSVNAPAPRSGALVASRTSDDVVTWVWNDQGIREVKGKRLAFRLKQGDHIFHSERATYAFCTVDSDGTFCLEPGAQAHLIPEGNGVVAMEIEEGTVEAQVFSIESRRRKLAPRRRMLKTKATKTYSAVGAKKPSMAVLCAFHVNKQATLGVTITWEAGEAEIYKYDGLSWDRQWPNLSTTNRTRNYPDISN